MMRISLQELARNSGVSERTLRRIESAWGRPNVETDTLERLQSYFENEGMTFIPDSHGIEGPGVRWGKYPGRVVAANRPDAA